MNKGLDLVGRQIGAYRVDALIGAGGYSRVYRAIDENVGRHAAIKVLLPSHGETGYSEMVIQRFEREARIVANLRDPHSVQLYEYGQTDDGMLYMIFEFIEGDTLEKVRRREGALPALRVVKILEQVLLSLEEAHTMGLVHRDIKPANIMLFEHVGRTDQVKVLDFGVGKTVGGEGDGADITKTGVLIGTPRYMAPEQWSSDGEITQQTDIYSLGLVVYELLTGERAINASEPVHIMRAHIDDEPIELPEDLDIPSGLRRVVNTMIAKGRQQRYDSATEVLQDLTRLKPEGSRSDTLETDERELKRQAGPPTAEMTDRGSTTAGAQDASATNRKPVVLALIVSSTLVGLLGIFYAFSDDPTSPGGAEAMAPSKEAQIPTALQERDSKTQKAKNEEEVAEAKVEENQEVEALEAQAAPKAPASGGSGQEASAPKAHVDGEEPKPRPQVQPTGKNAANKKPTSQKRANKTRSRAERTSPQPSADSVKQDSAKQDSAKQDDESSSGGNLILYPADEE